jgi:hypothetical protein
VEKKEGKFSYGLRSAGHHLPETEAGENDTVRSSPDLYPRSRVPHLYSLAVIYYCILIANFAIPMVERLDTHIESLIFVAQQPVKREDIRYNLENALQVKVDDTSVDAALDRLQQKYWDDNFAIEIVEVAEGFQFVTKGAYHHIAGHYLKQLTKNDCPKFTETPLYSLPPACLAGLK